MRLFFAFAACDLEKGDGCGEGTQTFTGSVPTEADVLWVIDDSVSMAVEQELLAAAIPDFLSAITSVDANIGVVTTDISAENADAGVLLGSPPYLEESTAEREAELQERMLAGTEGDGKERGLAAALLAVTLPLIGTSNAGFLRTGARLSVVVLSDEDDCSGMDDAESGEACYTDAESLTPVADIVASLRGAASDVRLSAIVGSATGCDGSVPGTRYWEAVEALDGALTDICASDYAATAAEIGAVTVAGQAAFDVEGDPAEITVEVDGAVLEEGWWYADGWLHFDADTVPTAGQTITVSYDAECD